MTIVGKLRLGLVRLFCVIFDLQLICEQIWCRNTDCGARYTFWYGEKLEPLPAMPSLGIYPKILRFESRLGNLGFEAKFLGYCPSQEKKRRKDKLSTFNCSQ